MATLWNPADEIGTVFSNTNHTATANANGNQGCRAHGVSHAFGSGKFYIENNNIVVSAGGSGTAAQFGNFSDTLGDTGGGQFGITKAGGLYGSASSGGNVGAPSGHNISWAIDFNAKVYWARLDGGTWVGDGTVGADPVAGTHGRDFTTAVGPFIPMCWFQNGAVAPVSQNTLNAGDTAFTYAIPSGFVAWDTTPPPPPPFARGQVIS